MRVGLFVTCLVDLMRPSIGFAALELLEQAGCEVIVPVTQTCCGQPGYNAGDRASGLALARKVLAEFEEFDYVVAPSGSCSGQMKLHVVEDLFKGESEEADFRALAAKWYELSDFLVNVLKIDKLAASSTAPSPFTIAAPACVNSASSHNRVRCSHRPDAH